MVWLREGVVFPRGKMEESGSLGFVIDTEGSARIDPPKYLKSARSPLEEEKDEIELKLEEVLFGKQPFQPAAKCGATELLDSVSEIEEVFVSR